MLTQLVRTAMAAVLIATLFTSAAWSDDPPPLEVQINTLIVGHEYGRATSLIEDALRAGAEDAPALRLRLARVLLLNDEPRRAIEVCQELIALGPDAPQWEKAHFLAADAHAALGEFAEAEALIHDQVVHLLSPARKDELAQIYVGHADALFEPEDEDEEPNFEQARFYYEQALGLGLGEEQSRALRHRVGQCWVELERWNEAASVYRELLEETEDTPMHPTVLFELGRAELRLNQLPEARHHLRRLLSDHADAEEVAEAERLLPETFGGTGPVDDVMLRLAVDAYETFIAHHPDHEKAEQAALDIAHAHQHRGRTAEAVAAVERFLRDHDDGELAPDARILLGELHAAAQAYDSARDAWNDFLRSHPTNPRWTEMQRRLVDLDFSEAQHLIAEEEWDDATRRLEAFVEAYPLEARQAEALHRLGQIQEEQENWEEALAIWEDLADKFPRTEPARRALMRSAEIAERELGDIERARELYREAREQGVGAAQSALTLMENPELTIETEQAFLPGESPTLHLVTRNIETIECAAYAIDLETYFRAKHSLAGVADLDIALIDPDETWEHTVEDYEDFRVYEQDIELPMSGPGAWAIRLATEDLEATSLVLVTDLALIAKASRNQVLVFTERWGAAEPAQGVRVLLSDGEEIFAELTTEADGTVLFEDDEDLRDLASLRVLVTDGDSVACSELDLQSSQHVEGRQPRGFVWSAKPVYQPGQVARVAGVIRVVEDGRYVFAEGEEWQVSVADTRGQAMFTDTVTLDDFGAFALTCPLPPSTATGQCTVTVWQDEGPSFNGAFRIDRYQVDQTQLLVELARRSIVRGEAVEATVTLRRYTGEPLREAHIEYQLPGDIRHDGTTDERGELEISLETDEIAGEGAHPLQVWYPEENLLVTEMVFLCETSITATVSTVRPIYLAEEPFEISVATEDINGDVVGASGTVTVVRVTDEGGEAEVSTHDIRTDDETGDGRVQIAVAEGGLHRLRVEGADADGRPWTAQATVTISDEDDEVRLRLLADRDTCRVGETAELTVVNRSDARLALATWETERILRHEVIELRGGRSSWDFDLSTEDSPSITAALSLIDGTELHTAVHALQVENEMIVSIEPTEDIVEPGEEIEVRVTAHDPAGNPVAARLALALVDRALLARYPDTTTDIADFFFGAARRHTMRTGSSADFSYDGVTNAIAQTLLDERSRIELARQIDEFSDRGSAIMAGVPVASASPMAPGMPMEEAGRLELAQEVRMVAYEEMYFGAPEAMPDMVADNAFMRSNERGARYGYDAASGTISEGDVYRTRNGHPSSTARRAGRGGGAVVPRRNFAELAFFDPTVTTDERGEATVTIPMPDNTTLWRMVARGTTRDTLVGEGEGEVTTRRDFYVSTQAPAQLTEGDRLFLPVRVHNLTDEARETDLTVTARQSEDRPVAESTVRLSVPANGHAETTVEMAIDAPRDITLLVEADAGELSDALEQVVPVQAWGEDVADARGGIANGDQTIQLALANARDLVAPQLTIDVFPDWEDALIEPLANRFAPGPASVASRALVDVAMLDYLSTTSRESDARYAERRLALQAAVAHLLGTQRNDGGWAWIGERGSDLPATAQSLRALIGAERHGVWVDPAARDRAVSYLQSAQRSLSNDDLASRAEAQHALTIAGHGDFTLLNALHRERNRLDVRSLALVTLAFDAMGRPAISGELAQILSSQFTPTDDPIIICWEVRTPVIHGGADTLEATALAVLALQRTQGLTDQVEGGIRFLMDRLPQPYHFSDRAAAATASALGEYHAETRPAAARLEIDVLVDGEEVRTIRWLGAPEPVHIALEEGTFDPESVRIDLRTRGDGQFAYLAALSAFRPGVDTVNFRDQNFTAERDYLQAERRHGGRLIPRGRSTVQGNVDIPRNPATAVESGGEVIVNTRFHRWNNLLPDAYVVAEEPLPLGTQVVEGSLSGNFIHSEILPDRIVLHFDPSTRWSGSVNYRLRGVVPGQWRVLPTTVRNLYNPEHTRRGNPGALTVLREDQPNPDTYTLSPDEHYHLGLWLAEEGQHAEALTHLLQFQDEWTPTTQAGRETALQILESAIALRGSDSLPAQMIAGTANQLIVRFFEVLHERHPDVILTWDQMITVAEAYLATEEPERAWQVLRGAAEASFLRDAQVAGVLEAQGAHGASITHMDDLIATYPDLPPVQSALLSLAGAIESKANDASLVAALEEEGLSVAELHDMALDRLEEFLANHPEHPRAPEALLTLATLWLDLDQRENTVTLCETLRRCHESSPLVSEAIYTQAYAHFLMGEDEAALTLCGELIEGEFPTASGVLAQSPNRPQAQYITAQIRHAQGDPAAAIDAYRIVEDRFPDAAQAIAHFTRRDLGLPEITSHSEGEAATVEITSRNLDEVHLRVYRVDLMTLYLIRRNLDQIVDIDLAGITPSLDQTVAIGATDDYADFDTEVDLGVEETGAYLVVAAAENLMASGLVLITDIEVEVQEDPTSGRVRANVTDAEGHPLADADVRVIGQGNEAFSSGETDRRGIFVADGIQGTATVLVRADDQFAFHRGVQPLGAAGFGPPAGGLYFGSARIDGDFDVLGNELIGLNAGRFAQQSAEMQTLLYNTQEGVDLYRVR
jgi:alpha-2-macroglobulin